MVPKGGLQVVNSGRRLLRHERVSQTFSPATCYLFHKVSTRAREPWLLPSHREGGVRGAQDWAPAPSTRHVLRPVPVSHVPVLGNHG